MINQEDMIDTIEELEEEMATDFLKGKPLDILEETLAGAVEFQEDIAKLKDILAKQEVMIRAEIASRMIKELS